MANRRILPLADPDLVSYPHLAFPLAVMQQEPDALRWVYSNFVQLYLSERGDEMMVDFFTPNPFDQFVPGLFGCPRLTRDLVRKSFPSFADFVRDSIDNDYALWTFVDEFYIPGSVAYQNRSNPHGLMIHGYDDEARQFHVAGFLSNQRFGSSTVDYGDMEKAYNDYDITESRLYTEYTLLMKPNPGFMKACEFNLQWVMDQLEDYALAKPSDRRMPAYELHRSSPHVWGMDIYDELRRRTGLQIENRFILDHRPFHVLWEHKKMMNRRIAYMERQGYCTCSPETAEVWRELEKSAWVNVNLILKYWMTRDSRHLEKLIERLDRIKRDESLAIERLLEESRRAPQPAGLASPN